MLSELDGGPPRSALGSSAWSILQHGIDAGEDKHALIVPFQSADHLKELVGSSSDASECLKWTYSQLRRGAARLAHVLDSHQIPPNATLLHFIPNNAEWILLVWLSAWRCYTEVGLLPSLLAPGRQAEVRQRLNTLKASVIVVSNNIDAAMIDAIRDKDMKPFLGICVSPLTEPRKDWISICDVAEITTPEQHVAAKPTPDSLDRVVLSIFTSGSTGPPKCAQKNLQTLLAGTAASMRVRKGPGPAIRQITAIVTSNTQVTSFTMAYLCWASAGTVVLPAAESLATNTLDAIERYGVSVIGHLPEFMGDMRKLQSYSPEKVKSLRVVFLTGVYTTATELEQAQKTIPGAHVYPVFGMTEVIGVLGWPVEQPKCIPVHLGVVSSGTAMPAAKIRIADDNGKIVKRGVPGELHVCGGAVFSEYLETNRRDPFYRDGQDVWFKTGDVATMDEAGQVYVFGRLQDIIWDKGVPLFPSSIEDQLMKEFKDRVRVVSISSTTGEELPYAIFQETEIKKHVVLEYDGKHRIGGVTTLNQLGLNSWPRSPIGKLSRLELSRAVNRHLESTTAETGSPASAVYKALVAFLSGVWQYLASFIR